MNQCVWFGKICMPYVGYLYTFLEMPEKFKKFQTPKSQKVLNIPQKIAKNPQKSPTYFSVSIELLFSFQKVKAWRERKKFEKKRDAAVTIQARYRSFAAR